MSNIKLKNNYWVTDGIYDTTQAKTQKAVNEDLATLISSSSASIATLSDVVSRINFTSINNINVANQDLNNYTYGGIWYFPAAYTPVNKPINDAAYGFLIVICASPRLVQFWVSNHLNVNNVYFRTYMSEASSPWGAWKRVTTHSDLGNIIAPLTETLTATENLSKGDFRINNNSLYHMSANVSSGSPITVGTNAELIKMSDLFKAKQINVTLANPLPSYITAATVKVFQAGNIVNVQLSVKRTSTGISNFVTLATGLPASVAITIDADSEVVPFGLGLRLTSSTSAPLHCVVNTSGELRVKRGNAASTFYTTFSYLTNDFSKL